MKKNERYRDGWRYCGRTEGKISKAETKVVEQETRAYYYNSFNNERCDEVIILGSRNFDVLFFSLHVLVRKENKYEV